MPKTFDDLRKVLKYPSGVSAYDARYAIEAGAYYSRQLRHTWSHNRAPIEAHWLGTASYNRGTGNILKDQAECAPAPLWKDVEPCTAKHTPETPAYVKRIRQLRAMLAQ